MPPIPNAPKIAITCGDPHGVGPEVMEHTILRDERPEELCAIGPAKWLHRLKAAGFTGEAVSVGPSAFVPIVGAPSVEGARVALEAMEAAAEGAGSGRFSAVVTGPVSKGWLQRVGFTFPGQTEFFADRWGGQPTMAFAGDRLRVVLATWHIPLRDVPEALTRETLARSIERAAMLAHADGRPEPRIGVCGLNPHAGEDGILGDEERDAIDPWLAELRNAHVGLSSCVPGDTVFLRALRGEFDVVVALYHDQGLAPLKTLEFDTAVNITLGLPHVRTSPDHGTGFDIAGKGTASPTSSARALAWARKLVAAAK